MTYKTKITLISIGWLMLVCTIATILNTVTLGYWLGTLLYIGLCSAIMWYSDTRENLLSFLIVTLLVLCFADERFSWMLASCVAGWKWHNITDWMIYHHERKNGLLKNENS